MGTLHFLSAAASCAAIALLGACGSSTQPAAPGDAAASSGDAGPDDGAALLGDAALCSHPDGPLSTSDMPRRTLSWVVVAKAPADGGSTEEDAGPSGCQGSPSPGSTTGMLCQGSAWLRSQATGPVVTFDDGSELVWDPAGALVLPPYLVQASGDRVWVVFQSKSVVVCPFCGAYETATLEIRDGAGGRVRFLAQQGAVLPNLRDDQIIDIFGVPAVARAKCSFPGTAGCWTFQRNQFDHALATTPEQLIPHAETTAVTSPKGIYSVFWAGSTETNLMQRDQCADGPGVATDTGFAASLHTPN